MFRFPLVILLMLITTTLCISERELRAQADAEALITESSDLSQALSAEDWSRVEKAVDSGLAWLAVQQAADGRFPSEDVAQPAVTSLAVMAFLSRGHVPGEGPYGQHLISAIDFVLSTQRSAGYFSLLPVTPPAHHLTPAQTVTYNHAIAGLMLGEVYGMTSGEQSRRIETALAKALAYHRAVQSRQKSHPSEFGGWRYGEPDSPNASSDMSVTGWALMFLRSARNAEFNVPKQYFDEGLQFVEQCYEPDPEQQDNGVFRYRPLAASPGERPQATLANTASAMLTLLLGNRPDHPGIPDGVRWFRSRPYPRTWQNPYYYLSTYYSSQALAQVGGEAWRELFPQIARNLLEEQTDSGAWPPGIDAEQRFGSTYSTSFAVLALTPAYQLLPIYQR